VQHNACADAVNDGSVTGAEVGDCDDQETACIARGPAPGDFF
jgi:hypothetical protein